jgi:cation-transporting ATPase E
VQEVRAKRVLDRLSLLSAPKARVVRDGAETTVPLPDVVRDDVVLLSTGEQVPADGPVLDADGLEIDESLLTGESRPVVKRAGDRALSGSFVVAGSGSFRAERVGAEAYASELAAEARRFALTPSELRRGVDRILRIVLWLMIPIGLLTAATQYAQHAGWRSATVSTVAALSAMVPQGLVLLTSVAFAVSVVVLGRRKVLVQELAAVEVLARVDVVCVDKTGTLTESALEVDRLEPLTEEDAAAALGALAALDDNATARALAARFPAPGWNPVSRVAFSSSRKWSGADFGGKGCWLMGAPEMLLPDDDAVRAEAGRLAETGSRVMLVARCEELPAAETQPVRGTQLSVPIPRRRMLSSSD